jgi:hypothetical protein
VFDIGDRLLFLSPFFLERADIKQKSEDDKGYIDRERDVYSIPLFLREKNRFRSSIFCLSIIDILSMNQVERLRFLVPRMDWILPTK